MIDKFVGKPYNYLYNQFKVDLDELILDLDARIADLEAVAAFQLQGVWWEPVLPTVPTTFGAIDTAVMLAGSVAVHTLTDPPVTIVSPDTALTATTSSGGRHYTAHCLLVLEGTAGDVITCTAYKRDGVTDALTTLHSSTREVVQTPGLSPDHVDFSFYATETAEPGDTLELWVSNGTSTNPIIMSDECTVRLRPI